MLWPESVPGYVLFVALFLFSRPIMSLCLLYRGRNILLFEEKRILSWIQSGGCQLNPAEEWCSCLFTYNTLAWIWCHKISLIFRKIQQNNSVLSGTAPCCSFTLWLGYFPHTISNNVWQQKGISFMFLSILCIIIRSSKFWWFSKKLVRIICHLYLFLSGNCNIVYTLYSELN